MGVTQIEADHGGAFAQSNFLRRCVGDHWFTHTPDDFELVEAGQQAFTQLISQTATTKTRVSHCCTCFDHARGQVDRSPVRRDLARLGDSDFTDALTGFNGRCDALGVIHRVIGVGPAVTAIQRAR